MHSWKIHNECRGISLKVVDLQPVILVFVEGPVKRPNPKKGKDCFPTKPFLRDYVTGSTISTLLHDRINPKDCQVLSLGDTGFLQFFRVVSRDYGKPRVSLGFKLSW